MPQPVLPPSVQQGTPPNYNGGVRTYVDPQTGDVVTSVIAPRQPQTHGYGEPMYVAPQIEPYWPRDNDADTGYQPYPPPYPPQGGYPQQPPYPQSGYNGTGNPTYPPMPQPSQGTQPPSGATSTPPPAGFMPGTGGAYPPPPYPPQGTYNPSGYGQSGYGQSGYGQSYYGTPVYPPRPPYDAYGGRPHRPHGIHGDRQQPNPYNPYLNNYNPYLVQQPDTGPEDPYYMPPRQGMRPPHARSPHDRLGTMPAPRPVPRQPRATW